jgi:hypothetical protein
LANVLVTLNLLVFLIHILQELICLPFQILLQVLGARKTFFDDLCALTWYIVFDDWDALFRFKADGLEIALPST